MVNGMTGSLDLSQAATTLLSGPVDNLEKG
jgi:hypothetical protein